MVLVQKYITGRTAVKIAADIEAAIRAGSLAPGEQLPSVRALADDIGMSPATVASAYQLLQSRALVASQGRRGTRICHRPLATARPRAALAAGAVNAADGNPDPALLPDSARILRTLDYRPHLYGEPTMHEGLIALMRRAMEADGIKADHCCVVSGAMDGFDRLITEHLLPGDRIAVEDPGFTGHHDLAASRGLSLVPVRMDDEGMLPDALARACAQRVHAVLITPRVQSPTGAALSPERARELRGVLRRYPTVLVIEDDHCSFLAESTPFQRVHDPRGRWAHLRSFSKSFNPDLRLAVMTGDEETMVRLLDRLVVVERWVSMVLQSLAHELLLDSRALAHVRKAARTYDERREALVAALQKHGLHPLGRSGYNVWLPVSEETPTVQALAQAGWAVAPGERFRLGSPPGIRITASRFGPHDPRRFADAASAVLTSPHRIATA
ncbi:MAG: aminotransferase class I/II-fold pyridoxal phosphate-dependent enzyme [Phycisphaerae bacterium]|nr:aminotransferase class I/II-fold pyridoxal phosphate-dependent enzyme [Phycisphaerae bacterium]